MTGIQLCISPTSSLASVVMVVQDRISSPFLQISQNLQEQRVIHFHADVVGLLLIGRTRPLVETGGEDQATTVFEGCTEGSFLRGRLRTDGNRAVTCAWVLHPRRY